MLIKRTISRMDRFFLNKRQSNTFSNGLEGGDGLPRKGEDDVYAEDVDGTSELRAIHVK